MKRGVGVHDPQGHSEDKKAPALQSPQPEGASSGITRCLNAWLFVAMQEGGVARKRPSRKARHLRPEEQEAYKKHDH